MVRARMQWRSVTLGLLALIGLGLAAPAALAETAQGQPRHQAGVEANGQDASPALKLLMVLWRGETEAEQGFLAELEQQRLALTIDRIDANQDRARLARQFWQMGSRVADYDAVYSFGTTASVMTHSIVQGRVPQLYSMVSDPADAGLVTRPGGSPVFGITDAISAALKLQTAQQLFPIRRMAFLFNARERNARVQLEEISALCDELGIELTVLRVAPETSSLAHHLQTLRDGLLPVDTLYLPSDSYLISQSQAIMAALADTSYRTIGATAGFVREGALLAIAPDYQALGRQLARRLIALHRDDERRPDLRPIRVERPRILYNEATRARLGIEIPEALRETLTPIEALPAP